MQRTLPDWLKSYMQYSISSEAPDAFHFWTGVSVLAGALRSHVWLDMGYFRWIPNFYIVFVAPPGIVSKSTTVQIGMRLLREIPDVKFGPDAVTWQSLVQSLARSTQEFNLGNGEMMPMSAITIVSSEFGTFLNPTDREMVDVLVSLWDGQVGVFEKATKTMGNDSIINPFINAVACTTPAWIQGHFPEYLIGGGFTSRTIFVYAEKKRRLIAYPGQDLSPEHKQLRQTLIEDLEIISNELIGAYELTPHARKWGEEWYEKHNERMATLDPDDRLASSLARKQTHIHKLGMVLAAARKNELVIDREDLVKADALVSSVEGVLPRVFSRINAPEARATNRIAQIVSRNGTISYEAAYRMVFQQMSFQEFSNGVNGAVGAGLLKIVTEENEKLLVPTSRLRETPHE